jgi:hypothetical protein
MIRARPPTAQSSGAREKIHNHFSCHAWAARAYSIAWEPLDSVPCCTLGGVRVPALHAEAFKAIIRIIHPPSSLREAPG